MRLGPAYVTTPPQQLRRHRRQQQQGKQQQCWRKVAAVWQPAARVCPALGLGQTCRGIRPSQAAQRCRDHSVERALWRQGRALLLSVSVASTQARVSLLGNTGKGTVCCSRPVTHTLDRPVSVWAAIERFKCRCCAVSKAQVVGPGEGLTCCCLFFFPAAAAGCLASACTLPGDRTWKQPRSWGP